MQQPELSGGRLKGTAATADGLIAAITDNAKLLTYPVKFRVEEAGSCLDYYAVFHIWCRAMAEQFTARDKTGKVYTEEHMHDLLCTRFLGIEPGYQLGKSWIPESLRTLTRPKLSKPELYDLLRKVELWCADVAVTLPEKDSDYSKDKARQDA